MTSLPSSPARVRFFLEEGTDFLPAPPLAQAGFRLAV